MLSKIKSPKDTYSIFSLTGAYNTARFIESQSRMVVAKGQG
jgi:hypothetical protein